MKKQLYFLLFLMITGLYFTGCSKPKDTMPSQPDKSWTIKVVEYKTNKPVSEAKFEPGNCADIGWGGECIGYTSRGSWLSNASGEIFMKDSYIWGSYNRTDFSKPGYWGSGNYDSIIINSTGETRIVKFAPYAWMKIHLKTETALAGNGRYSISFIAEPDQFHFGINGGIFPFLYNLDTTIIYKAYGNCFNRFHAQVEASGGWQEVYSEARYVNEGDTLNWEILLK
jgi:hypothetical protein